MLDRFITFIILSFVWVVGFLTQYWWVILISVIIEHFATREDSPKQKRQKARKRIRRH